MSSSVPTYTTQIYVGLREGYDGEVHTLEDAKDLCQSYVNSVGLCVTVTQRPSSFTSATANRGSSSG